MCPGGFTTNQCLLTCEFAPDDLVVRVDRRGARHRVANGMRSGLSGLHGAGPGLRSPRNPQRENGLPPDAGSGG